MKRFIFGAACALGLVFLPGVAFGDLSLRIGPSHGPDAVDADLSPPGGVRTFDLTFIETGTPQDEGLSTYDIGLRILRPTGVTGGIRLVPVTTSAQRRALTESPNYVFTDTSVTVPQGGSDEDHLQVNFDNTGDELTNITTGMTAGRISYVVDPDAPPGRYTFVFQDAVFATGIEGRPLEIPVTLDDAGVIRWVPEPSGLSVVAMALATLSRRRRLRTAEEGVSA